MESGSSVAMGGTRVVNRVASLSDRALLPRGRGWRTITVKPVYEANTNIFITKLPTCRPMDGSTIKPPQFHFPLPHPTEMHW